MKFKLLGKLRNNDDDDNSSTRSRSQAPVDQVRQMTQQGYSESEITEELRDQGYSYMEINQAMNSAVRESARRSGGNMPSQGMQGRDGQQGMAPGGYQDEYDQGYADDYDDYDDEPARSRRGAEQPPRELEQQDSSQLSFDRREEPVEEDYDEYEDDYDEPSRAPAAEDTFTEDEWSPSTTISAEQEELIEIIVAEHMNELEDEFDRIYADLEQLKTTQEELSDRVAEMEIRKDEDEKMFLQKVNEMEQHFEETHSRMGGMEKALKNVLPSLVENVRELSSAVKDIREDQNGGPTASAMDER